MPRVMGVGTTKDYRLFLMMEGEESGLTFPAKTLFWKRTEESLCPIFSAAAVSDFRVSLS